MANLQISMAFCPAMGNKTLSSDSNCVVNVGAVVMKVALVVVLVALAVIVVFWGKNMFAKSGDNSSVMV